jgi:hypothetical protein
VTAVYLEACPAGLKLDELRGSQNFVSDVTVNGNARRDESQSGALGRALPVGPEANALAALGYAMVVSCADGAEPCWVDGIVY